MCKLVIPNTVVMCGEGENYCSTECQLAALWEKVKALPPMTPAQRKAQRASWAYGQMACMSRYENATPEELAALWRLCLKASEISEA